MLEMEVYDNVEKQTEGGKIKGEGKRRGGRRKCEKFRRKKMRASSYFTDEETEAQRPNVT